MSSINEKLRKFLNKELGLDVKNMGDDEALFTSGLVDSFSLIELLAFVENDLNVKIDIADVSIDDLDTISALATLIEK